MNIPHRLGKHVGGPLLVALLVVSMLAGTGLLANAFGQEAEEQES